VDPVIQIMNSVLDGFEQGTAKVVTIGTSAAAVAAWRRARSAIRRHQPAPGPAEQQVLAAEAGQQVDAETLLRLLRLLSPAEMSTTITVAGDYVAGPKNVFVQGDYVARDKRP
jgi:hypothetical protein